MTPLLFDRLPEQRRPGAPKAPDDREARCHQCGRWRKRRNMFPEEKMLRLVYVCRRCVGT